MNPRSSPLLAVALTLAAAAGLAPPASAEAILDCGPFRTRWSAASQAAEAGRPALAFERVARPSGTERVTNTPGVQASLVCREGKLTHLELRDAGERAGQAGASNAFGLLAGSVLSALEGDLPHPEAARLLAALRAEAGRGVKAASQFGAYEITVASGEAGRTELVLDLPEN